jgi:hypothetical protein
MLMEVNGLRIEETEIWYTLARVYVYYVPSGSAALSIMRNKPVVPGTSILGVQG